MEVESAQKEKEEEKQRMRLLQVRKHRPILIMLECIKNVIARPYNDVPSTC